jgi:hypothetical protein
MRKPIRYSNGKRSVDVDVDAGPSAPSQQQLSNLTDR